MTHFPTDLHFHRLFLMREIAKRNPKRVLDIGCGKGLNINYYRMVFPNVEFVGIDIFEPDIEEAKKKQPEVEFLTADVVNLPFKDGEFDLLISDGVMMYVKDIEKGVAELKRVAKSIVLCEQTEPNSREEQLKDYKKIFGEALKFETKIKDWGDPYWDRCGWIMCYN